MLSHGVRAAASRLALLWSHPGDCREKTLCCQRPGGAAGHGSWRATTHLPRSPEAGRCCPRSAGSSPYRRPPAFRALQRQSLTQSARCGPAAPAQHAQGAWLLLHALVTSEDVAVSSSEERNRGEGVRRESWSTAELTLLFDFDSLVLPPPA